MPTAEVIHGDCTEVLPTLASGSIDAVICDPPYPYIKREYGWWDEAAWRAMMDPVVTECRRVLKPTGSAVFILQPNSERVGRMRGWLWRFLADWCERWGVVQDAYWWNTAAQPTAHTQRSNGLCRQSLKTCAWLGYPGCYRDQGSVLWSESQANQSRRAVARCGRRGKPSGHSVDEVAMTSAAVERGGVTPFNVLPIANTNNVSSAGAHGHGAGTPLALMRWWTRYLCPPGGTILDPFGGSGTAALAALQEGRSAVLVERKPEYVEIARRRIAEARAAEPLFAGEG